MAYQMSKKQWAFSITYGQGMIALLTILNVFYPQYLGYTFIIFIIGMVAFTAVMMKSQLKHITSKEAKEIKEGRRLYKSDPSEIRELQARDAKLVAELKPMMKSAGLSFLSMIVVFAWYPLYFRYARDIASSTTDLLVRLGVFLAGYEIPYLLITLINLWSRRVVKDVVQIVNNYEVYNKGVLGMGLTIKFPLEENKGGNTYKVVYNPSRRFVEFVIQRGKTTIRYRLYSRSCDRLADIIKRYGKPKNFEVVRDSSGR